MKWIGQNIYDQISRFRNDVYLEDISSGTIASGGNLGLDSNNKIVKQADTGISDLHGAGVDGSNNQLLTDDGDGTITSEANLTFDGSILNVTGVMDISPANDAGAPALIIDNDDVDQIALDINASNTTGNIIDINAQALTTGKGIFADFNSLEGLGKAIWIDVDESSTTGIQNTLALIDYNRTGNLATSQNNRTTGLSISMNDLATGNHAFSSSRLTALDINLDHANADALIAQQIGIDLTLTDGDTGYISTVIPTVGVQSTVEDGGFDIVMRSSADTGDHCTIATTTHGATTITTVDDDAAAAHFEIAADGDITLDAAGDIALEGDTTITGDATIATTGKMKFRDANSYVYSPTANDLEVVATVVTLDAATSVQLETPQVTLNGGSGNASFSLYSTGQVPQITLQNAQSGVDGRDLGRIQFTGNDDASGPTSMCQILAETSDATDGEEAGRLNLLVSEFDGTLTTGLTLDGDTNADGEVDVTIGSGAASTTTVAGNLALSGDTITSAADLKIVATGNDILVDTDNFTIESSGSHLPLFKIKSTSDGADGGHLFFEKDRGAAQVNDDIIGNISWYGENDAQESIFYGNIIVQASEVDDTDEAGRMSLLVAESNGSVSHQTAGLVIEGSDNTTDGEVNATIGAGAASTTTVAGTLTMGSTATLNNTGILQTAAQTNITSVGTLTALTVDNIHINANSINTVSGDLAIIATGNDITVDTDNFLIESASTAKPVFTLLGTSDGNKPVSQFYKHISASPATGDGIAEIQFQANNDADELISYARINANNEDATDGAEEGNYEIGIKNTDHATSPRSSFKLTGNGAATDATIGFGATSVTAVAGTLTMGSTAAMTNAGLLSVAAQTNITSLGTLTGLTTSGAIELGHASDTTLARSAAGKVTIEGNQIVTAGATTVASATQVPIGMQIARRTITQAEMNDLHNTPIAIIPALGANLVAIPVNGTIFVDRAANQTANAQLMIGYGSSAFNYSIYVFKRFHYNISTDFHYGMDMYVGQFGTSMTAGVNTAINASANAAYTNNAFTSVDVYINYYVIDRS